METSDDQRRANVVRLAEEYFARANSMHNPSRPSPRLPVLRANSSGTAASARRDSSVSARGSAPTIPTAPTVPTAPIGPAPAVMSRPPHHLATQNRPSITEMLAIVARQRVPNSSNAGRELVSQIMQRAVGVPKHRAVQAIKENRETTRVPVQAAYEPSNPHSPHPHDESAEFDNMREQSLSLNSPRGRQALAEAEITLPSEPLPQRAAHAAPVADPNVYHNSGSSAEYTPQTQERRRSSVDSPKLSRTATTHVAEAKSQPGSCVEGPLLHRIPTQRSAGPALPVAAESPQEPPLRVPSLMTRRNNPLVSIQAESPGRSKAVRSLARHPRSGQVSGMHSNRASYNNLDEMCSDPQMNVFDASIQSAGVRRPTHHSRLTVDEHDAAGFRFINEYLLEEEIGCGSFGKVFRALDKVGASCAIKIVTWARLLAHSNNVSPSLSAFPSACATPARPVSVSPDNGEIPELNGVPTAVLREVVIMRRLNHPNLLRLTEVINHKQGKQLLLVLPLMRGPLLNVSNRGNVTSAKYNEAEAKKIIRQVLAGLRYMHDRNILHLDIKPGNILLDDKGDAFISDFGTSRFCELNGRSPAAVGSPAYLPPEAFKSSDDFVPNGKANDFWALGVTLFMMIYGRHPFAAGIGRARDVAEAIKQANLVLPEMPVVSDPLKDLLRKLLDADLRTRYTEGKHVRLHPWLRELYETPTSLTSTPWRGMMPTSPRALQQSGVTAMSNLNLNDDGVLRMPPSSGQPFADMVAYPPSVLAEKNSVRSQLQPRVNDSMCGGVANDSFALTSPTHQQMIASVREVYHYEVHDGPLHDTEAITDSTDDGHSDSAYHTNTSAHWGDYGTPIPTSRED
jgi:serine/threonine protein kinase